VRHRLLVMFTVTSSVESYRSSAGPTVRDEPWPLTRLLTTGLDPVTFVSI
jgi:hypothetical protein